MAGKVNQLRFDISEKVRLHSQQPGIGTLLELDLYPDVEIEDQETHLKIQGYLRLNGAYLPEQGGDVQADENEEAYHPQREQKDAQKEEIAYVIPVEITLPTERVDMENIASEIESFDYKVLSPFELQIEALLTIDGFIQEWPEDEETAPATFSVPSEGEMRWDQEPMNESQEEQDEYEFVHVARLEEDSPEEEITGNQGEEEPTKVESVHESDDTETEKQAEMKPEAATDDNDEQVDQAEKKEEETGYPPVHFHPQPEKDRKENSPFPQPLRKPHNSEFDLQQLEIDERTRFGMEKLLEESESVDPSPQQQELSTDDEDNVDDLNAEDAQEGEEKAEENKGSNLEWAQWILGEEQDRFVKLRMVIVHKNDSIDSLSDRYNVSASKIMHLNRLETDVLEEGQVVYIPS